VAEVGTHTQHELPPLIDTQHVGLCCGLHQALGIAVAALTAPTDPVLIYPNTVVIFYPYNN